MRNHRTFYKELGNLFYSIAAADKHIRPEEKEVLHNEILFTWKHHEPETDRFGTDRAFLIEFEFDTLEDAAVPAGLAYQHFEQYYSAHRSEFSLNSRIKIFNSARHIAECVRKINDRELALLVKLKSLLQV